MIMWSNVFIPRISPPCKSRFVKSISCIDGVTFPDGWLCTNITAAAESANKSEKTSRGWIIALFELPFEISLIFITSWFPFNEIAKKYSMISPNVSNTQTIRSVFFICPKQTIKAILQYPVTNGRNIAEILRLLDAMQFTDKQGFMPPANWLPNQPEIMPMPKTDSELMEKQNNLTGFNCIDWYLCFNSETPNNMINTVNFMDVSDNYIDSNINC